MPDTLKIAVDALGGDDAPEVVLEGVARALEQDAKLQILLMGPRDLVEDFALSHDRVEPCPCTEEISMADHPVSAIRKKKDSSLVVAARAVKEGRAQGFFSAGSTGACLAASIFVIGRIHGIDRPALCAMLPSPVAPTMLCDVGANADVRPHNLLQFAQMASIYAQELMGCAKPKVALLNIGSEDTKGNTLTLEAHALLREELEGFAGNAEGKDLLTGSFDVVVTDGFSGNIALKTMEGTAKVLFKTVKSLFMQKLVNKLAAMVVKKDFGGLKASLSPDTYGGAPLLGVKGAVVVGHGSSNAYAISNGILLCARIANSQLATRIEEGIKPCS